MLGALAVTLAVSVVQAAGQAGFRRNTRLSTDITANPWYYGPTGMTHAIDYGAGSLPILDTSDLQQLVFPVEQVRDDSIATRFDVGGGAVGVANLITVPQLVRMTARRRSASAPRGAAGLLGMAANLAVIGVRWWRRRRRWRRAPAADDPRPVAIAR
jgi:hypothetical protein